MDCLEFRRICLSEPQADAPEFVEHEHGCENCARYAREIHDFDELIARALRIEVPEPGSQSYEHRPAATPTRSRGRWLSLAASVLIAIGIGSGIWLSSPTDSMASEVVAHILHERQALVKTTLSVDESKLLKVLERSGVELATNNVGTVSYAKTCIFRGKEVPHLVVQGEMGPVTVLLLPDEHVSGIEMVAEDGFFGRIVPLGSGSIAIVGYEDEKIASIEHKIVEAVDWNL